MTPTEPASHSSMCRLAVSDEKAREIINSLLDDGEHAAVLDALAIDTDTEDIDDVTGWGCTVSLPRPPLYDSRREAVVPNVRKKQQRPSLPVAEMDQILSNMTVRFVNEDFVGDHQKSTWKANVEPGTFRYICNNGIYRASKFANMGTDWVTSKRAKHADLHHVAVTPELKQAQRTLRKDLDQHFNNLSGTKSIDNIDYNNRNNAHLNTSTPFLAHKPPLYRHTISSNVNNNHQQNHNNQSTHQDQQQKVQSIISLQDQTGSQSLPPPSRQQKDPELVKSTSDLFVENFYNRMSALEKSEKENNMSSNNAPVTPSGLPRPGHPNHNQSQTHKRGSEFTNIHSISNSEALKSNTISNDDISKDVFMVRPVTRAPDNPLGPLEKLTPHQKNIDRASESGRSSHTEPDNKSRPDSPNLPQSFLSAMNAFAQLQSSNRRGSDRSNRSKTSSHRGTYYKSSSTSNISDSDSISSVRNALTLTNSSIERMRTGSYGKSPVKDYGRFLPHGVNNNHTKRTKITPSSTFSNTAYGRSVLGNGTIKNSQNYRHSYAVNNNSNRQTNLVGYTAISAPSTGSNQIIKNSYNNKGNNNSNNVDDFDPSKISKGDGHTPYSGCILSDTPESYLSGASMTVNRGVVSIRDGKAPSAVSMPLPEIAGKRMPVAATSQRML